MSNFVTQPTVSASRLFIFYQHDLVLPNQHAKIHVDKINDDIHTDLPNAIHQLTHRIDNKAIDKQSIPSIFKIAEGYYVCQLTDAIAHHWINADSIEAAKQCHAMQGYRQLVANLEPQAQSLLAKAIGVQRWLLDHQFCSRCGTPTQAHPQGEPASICPSCGYRQYARIQPCIITAIHRQHPTRHKPQILLAHHHRHNDSKTANRMYGLIAGFVEVGETLEQAVRREVQEETSLEIDHIRYYGSQYWPYPSNLMLGFFAEYVSGQIVIAQDELCHAQFFDLDNLPNIPPKGSIAHELIHTLKQRVCLAHD